MPDDTPSSASVSVTDQPVQVTAQVAQAAAASPRVIWTIVLTVAFLTLLSMVGAVVLACLKVDNQVLLVALTSMANGGFMGLIGMLVSLKQQAPQK